MKEPEQPTTPYLSSAQACQRLGIDRSTLTRWVEAGKLKPVVKLRGIRGAYVFDAADIDQLTKGNK